MEVKNFNNVNFTGQANLNKTNKNQVAFQGKSDKYFVQAFKEIGIEEAPLFMIPDPMHFCTTLINKMYSEMIIGVLNVSKNIIATFKK